MEGKKSRKLSSEVWTFMVPISANLAMCKLCYNKFSHKGSPSNLKKHLKRKHPTLSLTDPKTDHKSSMIAVGLDHLYATDTPELFEKNFGQDDLNENDPAIEGEITLETEAQNLLTKPAAKEKKSTQVEPITAVVKELSDLNKNFSSTSILRQSKSKEEDECDVIGRHVAIQLRHLSADDLIDANIEIQQILTKYRKKSMADKIGLKGRVIAHYSLPTSQTLLDSAVPNNTEA